MENSSTDWSVYEAKYRPIYQDLFHRLEHEFEPRFPLSNFSTLSVVNYLKDFGLDSLAKVIS